MIFTNVIKPTHRCNLDCKYCYNDDVRDPVMRPEVLERVIEQTFSYVREHTPNREVNFIWHGGEPMVAGLPFFELAVELQSRHSGGLRYTNSLQTNGTLFNERWLKFVTERRFEVSISIDGPGPVNDKLRVLRGGQGSFERVFKAIQLVRDAGLPFGVCVVISRSNKDNISEIYQFLTEHRLPFNIIPLNRSGSARENYRDLGLEADEYATAWIELYDRWFDSEEDYVYCMDFVLKTRAVAAGRPADCIGLGRCADSNISVDPVGDVFPCATLSGSEVSRYGSLQTQSLAKLLGGSVAASFQNRRIDDQCRSCKWQHICHGGCPARALKFHDDQHTRDYYCPSLYRIYEHIENKLKGRIKNWTTPGPIVPSSALTSRHYERDMSF